MSSNHTYKELAYEKTVILALVELAKEHLLPQEGEEAPLRTLKSEDLPIGHAEVPEDAVIDVVMRLQRLANKRELDMSRYQHVLAEKNDEQEWSEEKPKAGAGSQGAGAAAGKGKAKGGGGGAQASAAAGGGRQPAHQANQPAAGAPGKRS